MPNFQGCSRSILSGMCPVRTPPGLHPLPPGFSQVFILKGLKVIYFHTLLQVFILKGLASQRFFPLDLGRNRHP
jgi:hypothetical protein